MLVVFYLGCVSNGAKTRWPYWKTETCSWKTSLTNQPAEPEQLLHRGQIQTPKLFSTHFLENESTEDMDRKNYSLELCGPVEILTDVCQMFAGS